MNNKIITSLLIPTVLAPTTILCSCSQKIVEGIVVKKEYFEERHGINGIPMGNGTTMVLIPISMGSPESGKFTVENGDSLGTSDKEFASKFNIGDGISNRQYKEFTTSRKEERE